MPPRKPLQVVSEPEGGLGLDTIMSRDLAARHGVLYVHLAAFAIDVDRVLEAAGDDDERPFGWDVFLTEVYLLAHVDPSVEAHHMMIEDVCLAFLESDVSGTALGAQLPFAIYDAIHRGAWPASMRDLFRTWRGRGDKLCGQIAALWQDADGHARRLAAACLSTELSPPLAPPTRKALEQLAAQ